MGAVESKIRQTVLEMQKEKSLEKKFNLSRLFRDSGLHDADTIGKYHSDLLPCLSDDRSRVPASPQDSDQLTDFDLKNARTSAFLLELTSILLDYIEQNNDRSLGVLDFHHPGQLRQYLDNVLFIEKDPKTLDQVLDDCRQTLKFCVRTGHPRFFNQISQGLDVMGLAGEWLTAATNTSICSYEVAPVFFVMEDIVLSKMREYIGWGSGCGDGILTPGGTMSNLYGVAVARQRAVPGYKLVGLSGMQRLVMFTSDQSHFSIKRAGVLLGIGSDNVILIKSDSRGKLIVSDLEEKLSEAINDGFLPFFVSCTAGTTVLGAFDPINEIADVCTKYGVWLHVDAAWGGGALLSHTHRHLLEGIERADSVTWNPHKLMGVPLQCSAFLVNQQGLLETCNSVEAATSLLEAAEGESTDPRTMQGSRHNDVFKVWLMWKAKGSREFEKQIDQLMDLSKYMQAEIGRRPGFKFVVEQPEFLNICFWYVPTKMRHLPESRETDEILALVAPKIKAMMMENGGTMIGYQPLGDKPNFFRMIVSNAASTRCDINYLLDEIEKFGEI